MRIPLPVNVVAAQPAPPGRVGSPAEAGPANESEALLCFADALDGLAEAGGETDFDAAEGTPQTADSKAADGPAADGMATGETPAMPALNTPLAIAITMPSVTPVPLPPAMPVVTAEPVPAATADQDIRLAKTGSSALASLKAPLAAPLDPVQRAAVGVGPAVPPPAMQADLPETMAAEVLQPKLKADNVTVSEHRVATAPEASVTVSAAPVSPSMPESSVANASPALKLPAGTPEQWRRPLIEALGDRIQVEVGKHSEQAVIRLDPPMLGSVEIAIRHQAGVLQVQLSASHDEVVRQLQHIGDSLRQDLSRNQYTDVSVQVFAGSRDGDGRQRPDAQREDRQPGRALAEAEAEQTPSAFVLSSDRD